MALQIALLVIGVAAFLWLINIVALNGDWIPDLSESISYGAWIGILIPTLAVVLIGEGVLFFFQRS